MDIEENIVEMWTPINLIDFQVVIVEYKKGGESKFYLKKINYSFSWDYVGIINRGNSCNQITPEFQTKRELYKYVLENYKKINKKNNH